MRLVVRASAWVSGKEEHIFRTFLARYSREHGELVVKGIYSSNRVSVLVTAILKAESEGDARILAGYAEAGEVPEPMVYALYNVSTTIADYVGLSEDLRGQGGSSPM